MGEWKEKSLIELADIIPGFAFKSNDFGPIGEIVIKIKDIHPPLIDLSSTEKVNTSNYDKNKLKKYLLEYGDFVVAMTGATIGKVGRLKEKKPAFINQRVAKINAKKGVNNDFIYYSVTSYDFQVFIQNNIDSHSAQENISGNSIGRFPILAPPLPEQTAIASILSSLDDKIDLLHRQNATLEKMAETLFRQWFVEEAKEEWENCVLEDLCSQINSGGTPSTKIETYYNGNINWYSTKELNDNYLFESISKITQDGLENSAAKLFPKGTVLIAIYAAPTVGRLGILGNQSAFNQAACGLIANDKICCKEFIYLYLKNQRNELNAMASGSAQQNLNVGKIKTYPAFIPDDITMNKFKREIIPFFEKIEKNAMQIRTIKALRDTLLPKLMSGEVRVEPD